MHNLPIDSARCVHERLKQASAEVKFLRVECVEK